MQLTRVVSCKPWEPAVGPLAHLQQPLLHGCAVATLLFFFISPGRMFSTTAWNQITAAALRHSPQSRACRNAIRGATACPVLENIRPGCQSFTLPTILTTPCTCTKHWTKQAVVYASSVVAHGAQRGGPVRAAVLGLLVASGPRARLVGRLDAYIVVPWRSRSRRDAAANGPTLRNIGCCSKVQVISRCRSS